MFLILQRRLQTEYHHFVRLGEDARKLLISFSFYGLVLPLVFGFVNAFLFRQSQNFISVVLYNTGLFTSIPVSFYINGLLLKFFNLKRLYQFGLLGQGFVLNLLFFWPAFNWIGLISFGLIQGFFVGVYWANRNFMSLEITNDRNRQYFVGLEQIIGIGSDLLAPLIIGAVITVGSLISFITPQESYKVLGVISFIFIVIAAKILGTTTVETPVLKKLLIIQASTQWWYVRIAEVIYGSFHGIYMFLPSLLVFRLVGEEGALGLMQSIAALITLVIVYYLSRKLKASKRVQLTAVAIFILIIISLYLSLSFIALAAIVFLTISPGITKVRWLTWNPIVMSVIDAQDSGDRNTNYAYIVDREFFINLGRLLGIAIFASALLSVSEEAAIRYSPVVISVVQLLFIFVMKKIVEYQ